MNRFQIVDFRLKIPDVEVISQTFKICNLKSSSSIRLGQNHEQPFKRSSLCHSDVRKNSGRDSRGGDYACARYRRKHCDLQWCECLYVSPLTRARTRPPGPTR